MSRSPQYIPDQTTTVRHAGYYRRSVATRLLAAFLLLALLPVAAALLGLYGVEYVQQPLDQVARTTLEFSARGRDFRRGIRVLSIEFADPGSFDSRAELQRTRSAVTEGLTAIRQNLQAIAGLGDVGDIGAILLQLRPVEQGTMQALEIADRRLAARERLDSLAGQADVASVTDARERFDSLDRQLTSQQLEMRRKWQNIIEAVAALDGANQALTRRWMDSTNTALQRFSFLLPVIAAFSTVLALALMYVLVQRNLLARLRGLTGAIENISNGRLDEPVPTDGRDELTRMAHALEDARRNALQLRENEQVLVSRTQELEQANEDLDRFAYVASHDLKAPMRAIESVVGFLEEDMAELLPEESARHLDMLRNRALRMQGLLDGLLEYSRAGRRRVLPENVDLLHLFEDCVSLVVREGCAVNIVGDNARVHTWRTPLEQIVRNLVDNAVKHNGAEDGEVAIDCRVGDRSIVIRVSDNGPGIDPRHHERIFEMFQTLHARDQREGSGIGLAILRRIVDSYGGSIDVQSDPARQPGATFVVEWPILAVVARPGNTTEG